MSLLKNTACSFVLLLGLATGARAQSLSLGIKAGVDFAQTPGKHLESGFKGHFLGGAFAGVGFAQFRLRAEALFSQSTITTGSNFQDAFGNYIKQSAQGIKEGTFKMNELSIPILLGFSIVPKLLWLQAGPQYTGVVSIKDVDGLLTETKNVFKSGYLSGVIGAELSLPFHLNLGARYVFGLSDRNNTNVSESWRTTHFQVHVGYSLL